MNRIRLLLVGLFVNMQASSQSFFGTAYMGGSNYQGEIQEVTFAFKGMRFAAGFGGQFRLHDHLWISTELMLAHLSGRDADIDINSNNIARNLSFETDIQELSILARLNLLRGTKQPFVPYVTGGGAVFRVDPYAFDAAGQKHFLYPLSTEGQGLPAYPDRKVPSKVNFSLPMGAGIEFRLAPRLRVDAEVMYRKSFSDYIDDVSTTYPDEALLLAARGPKAVELSYRSDERPGGSTVFPSGAQRGNPNRMDWYHSFVVRVKWAPFEPGQLKDKKKRTSSTDCWKGGGAKMH
jgi:opacity protein-like surface antigen